MRPRIDETALVVEGDSEGEVDNVEEDNALAVCFCEAVYALSATKDQPIVETAINGPESNDWKSTIEAELTQIEKLGTWEFIEAPMMPISSPAAGYSTVNAMHKVTYPITKHNSLPKDFVSNSASITQILLHPLSVLKPFAFFSC